MVKSIVLMTKESKRPNEPSGQENLADQFETDVAKRQFDSAVVDSFVIEHPQVAEDAVRKELGKIKRRARKAR